VPERDWVALVRSIAEGDQGALHALYERMHRLVFTVSMRITQSRETAEEVTLDVFYDVWRRAATYDPAAGTVIGWIMNQARSRAIDRIRFEHRKKRSAQVQRTSPESATQGSHTRVSGGAASEPAGGQAHVAPAPALAEKNDASRPAVDAGRADAVGADPQAAFDLAQQAQCLRLALTMLSPAERQAIETAYFSGLTHAETAVRLCVPVGTIKTRIRSGLKKLREAMAEEGRDP
jgi:RNA polymerase sigma-70 factor (ECF subfamily)